MEEQAVEEGDYQACRIVAGRVGAKAEHGGYLAAGASEPFGQQFPDSLVVRSLGHGAEKGTGEALVMPAAVGHDGDRGPEPVFRRPCLQLVQSARQIQSVEASASTSSVNISEGFFQSKILRGRSLISAAIIAR